MTFNVSMAGVQIRPSCQAFPSSRTMQKRIWRSVMQIAQFPNKEREQADRTSKVCEPAAMLFFATAYGIDLGICHGAVSIKGHAAPTA